MKLKLSWEKDGGAATTEKKNGVAEPVMLVDRAA